MDLTGNVVWNAGGSVWGLFRVPQDNLDRARPAALIAALGGLGCPSKLSSFDAPGDAVPGGRLCLLSVEIAAGGMTVTAPPVIGAAAAAVLRPFGLGAPRPGPRLAGVQRSAAARLVAGLAAFALTEPTEAEVRSAIGVDAPGWREVRGCGYAAGASGGRPRYRAWFAAMPLDSATAEWPLGAAGLAAAAWCVFVRPSRGGVSTALLARIESGDLVDLGERAAALRRAAREQGWDLVRPGSGQLLLGAAMVPGAANPRLPGSLFFPLPYAGGETVLEPSACEAPAEGSGRPVSPEPPPRYLLRVTRGPRQGEQMVLAGGIDVGRGGAGLDLADEAVDSRHVHVEARRDGAVIRAVSGLGIRVDGRPAGPGTVMAPGSRLQLGASELVLLRVAAACSPVEPAAPARSAAVDVSLRLEGEERLWSATIEAPAGARVADVLPALCEYLGLPPDRDCCLYAKRDGRLIPPAAAWVLAGIVRGDVLVVGPQVRGSDLPHPDAHGAPVSAAGPLLPLSRPPRSIEAPRPHRAELPAVPQETSLRARGGHWQAAAGAGLGLTAVVGGILFHAQLWLAVAGGCTSLFSMTAGLMADRSRRRHEERAFRGRVAALDGELAEVVERQQQVWDLVEPDPATILAWVAGRSDRLWERRMADPDFLALRLGTADRPALLALEGRPSRGRLGEVLDDVVRRHSVVAGAPLCLPGTQAPVTGIAGPPEVADGLARWLLLQAAALHAPRDLSIVVLATTAEWGWARWLPHAAAAGGPAVALESDRVDDLARSLARRPAGGAWTLVLADRGAAGRPAVAPLIEDAGSSRTTLVLASDRRGLPSGAAAMVAVGADGGLLTGTGAEGGPKPFRAETLPLDVAMEIAQAMAPLTELGSRPPAAAGEVGLLDLLGIDDPAAAPVESLWKPWERGA